jgi:putative oxidoreductase
MRNSKLNGRLVDIIAALLILLFVYTGINKLEDRQSFNRVLLQFPIITTYAGITSWSIPIAELIVATLLVFLQTRKIGFIVSVVLLSSFTIYTAGMLVSLPNCHVTAVE